VKHKLHRRTFTKLGLLSGGAWLFPIGPAFGAPLQHVTLSAEESELIDAFTEVMLPTEGRSLKQRSEVPILDNVARALANMDEPIAEQVRIGMKLFDYGAIVIGFHFARFSKLSIEDRIAYIHRWEEGVGMQRGIVDVLKKLSYVGYWRDIEAARAMGYQGPVSVAGGIPNLGNAPMPATKS
jgi:hypothetical protein